MVYSVVCVFSWKRREAESLNTTNIAKDDPKIRKTFRTFLF